MKTMIVAIGNELLNGKTQDLNSYWITKRLTSLGYEIVRTVIVPDIMEDIVEVLKWAETKDVKLIVTTGGLGPTPGDLTLDAIAQFTGRKIVLDERALDFVKKRYSELYRLGFVPTPELNESRMKMAKIPEGSRLIYNDVGVAPGVIVETEKLTILALPGVPSEMMYLLEKAIPLLPPPIKEHIYTREKRVKVGDESLLSSIFDKIMSQIPNLRIKSYPEGFGREVLMRIIFEYKTEEKEEADKAFEQAEKILNNELEKLEKKF
ncbi:MAG: competence/damage-inducible protein A [Candidatus Njordarchaeia archaeon]